MTSFSLYRNSNSDVDFLVDELAKQLSPRTELSKTASINASSIKFNKKLNVISNLMTTLVKCANDLDPKMNGELIGDIDEALSFISTELI